MELEEGVVEEGEEPACSCLEEVEVLSYQGEEVSSQDVVDDLHIEIIIIHKWNAVTAL